MTTDAYTSASSAYPLPHIDNALSVDVERIRSAMERIDADVVARLPISSYTAADILTKTLTVDGAGSGLDADTLDGNHAIAFSLAGHAHADATGEAAGFMSPASVAKLAGIGSGANVISVNSKTGAVSLDAADVGASAIGHAHAEATGEAAGFMSPASVTKLAGINSSTYVPFNVVCSSASSIILQCQSSSIGTATASKFSQLEIRAHGSGVSAGAAAFALLRPGVHGVYFGLDTDNQLKVGGWSKGDNAYKIWHAGNDGTGSGLDADTLDGLQASAFAAAQHTHEGGDVPVVKSVQNLIISHATSLSVNTTISSVTLSKSVIVLASQPQGFVRFTLSGSTTLNSYAESTLSLGVRVQVVEFY